jgi:hypothetical protein
VPTIYTKSAAGQREINSRSNAVSPRARTLLILVDGKRSDTELAALVPDFEASVDALLKAGLIVAAPGAAPPASARSAAAPAAAAAAPSATGTATATAAAPAVVAAAVPPAAAKDLATLRRDAARAVNDLLGPEGDALAMRIERAAEAEVLEVVLERCVAYIADTRGKRAAEAFAQRFLTPGG